jgi:hypothetical protein
MRKTVSNCVGVVALVAFLGGCAGGRGALAFDRLTYPVSSSPFIYGPDDRPYNPGELQPVGKMVWVERIWGLWWSWIPLSGTVDVSAPINAQIARAGGDGIINLRVVSQSCGMNYVPVFNIVPLYPGCAYVTITGDIVRMATMALPPLPGALPPPPGALPPPPGAPPPPPAAFIPKDKLQQVISARMNGLLAAK